VLYLHWGQDGHRGGSEHSVGQRFFPGELQIFGFNADLYKNLSHAFGHTNGAVGISVMIKEAERGTNKALSDIVHHARKVLYICLKLESAVSICSLFDREGLKERNAQAQKRTAQFCTLFTEFHVLCFFNAAAAAFGRGVQLQSYRKQTSH
jgi:hypothetical protein